MKITYDTEQDILRVLFSDAPIHRTSIACQGTLLDFDYKDRLVAVEVADASHRMPAPSELEAWTLSSSPIQTTEPDETREL